MAKYILFMLKPGFQDLGVGPYFCPGCATVEGFLKYAPEVAPQLDIRKIDFPRPRKEIIDLVGEENQGCPVLVFDAAGELPPEACRYEKTGKAYISGALPICEFLGRTFGVSRPHP